MMYDHPLFELHETLQGKDDNGNLINDEVLGKRFCFPVQNFAGGPRREKERMVGTPVHAIALRNTTGSALSAGALVKLDTAATDVWGVLKNAASLATGAADYPVVAVSGYLGSKTVADDDIFWGVCCGPTKVLTASSLAADISVGARIQAAGTANGGFDVSTTALEWLGFTLEGVTAASDTNVLKWVQMAARL